MINLTEHLDKVAGSLEKKGLLKEAQAIDVISNTLDLMNKEAWSAEASPLYVRFLTPAIKAATAGNTPMALNFLKNGEQARQALVEAYKTLPEAQNFSKMWLAAIKSLEQNQASQAVDLLTSASKSMLKLEPAVNNSQKSGPQQSPLPSTQSPKTDLAFPAKGVTPGVTSKRGPLQHPARALR